MPRNARKVGTTKRSYRRGRTYRRTGRYRRSGYRTLSRRISAVSRRVAGEVCKFESNPSMYENSSIVVGTSKTNNHPLNTITSGNPWIMPLNWIYAYVAGNATNAVYVDGQQVPSGTTVTASFKNPLWYNTSLTATDTGSSLVDNQFMADVSPGLQYRLKYIYINALFNASISSSVNNTDGALRIVIVKDKQPTGGAATWADLNRVDNSRGVFNANRIDAQLNPNTTGRFKIMYDKTLRFTTVNGYKPFKYYRTLSTVVRNNRDVIQSNAVSSGSAYNDVNNQYNYVQSSSASPPVLKNAFYLMIFSDGLSFTYSEASETPAAGFHLFNRIAYYNN